MFSQPDESQTGAWYMYFWNTTIKESAWGFQGDMQYRNWNLLGDLEQLLLRGGITWQPQNTPHSLSTPRQFRGLGSALIYRRVYL